MKLGTPARRWIRSIEIARGSAGFLLIGAALQAQLGQSATLLAADGMESDALGSAVSLSGKRALVGATGVATPGPPIGYLAGAVYVYEQFAGGWQQVQKISAPVNPSYDRFGSAIEYVGTRAAIGTFTALTGQSDYVAIYDEGAAGLQLAAILLPSDGLTQTGFGRDFDLDGDRVIVGARYHGMKGAAYVYERSGSQWMETAKLEAGGFNANFGASVALSGDRALVGAPVNPNAGVLAVGSVFLFELESGNWVQKSKWLSPAPQQAGQFGLALALDGETAIVAESFFMRGYALVGGAWLPQNVFGIGGFPLAGVEPRFLELRGERALIGRCLYERYYGNWTGLGCLPLPAGFSVFASSSFDDDQALLGLSYSPIPGKQSMGAVYVFDSLDATELTVRVEAPLAGATGAPESIEVGAIAATAGPTNRVELRFGFHPNQAVLDVCYDFRWVTVELSATVDGVPQQTDAQLGLLPAITPPASVDALPFRYTAAEWAAGTSGGTAIRKEGKYSLYFDEPLLPQSPAVVRRFHTFLVAHEIAADKLGAQLLGVLAGVAWEHDSATNQSRLCGEVQLGNQLIGQAIWDGIQACPGTAGCPGFVNWNGANLVLLPACSVFSAVPDTLSLTSGGASLLGVQASAAHAGAFYLVLGSLSGTAPGIDVGPYVVALNPDAYLSYTLSAPNHPPLANSLGVLDASGAAQPTFTLPALSDPALAGLVVEHAVVVLDATFAPTVVSSAAAITLLP